MPPPTTHRRKGLVQKLFFISVVVLLLEIVHKLSSLQRLIELQDQNQHLNGRSAWLPDSNDSSRKRLIQRQAIQDVLSPSIPTLGEDSTTKFATNSYTSPPIPDPICQVPPTTGPEGPMGFQALTKIRSHLQNRQKEGLAPISERGRLRVLCVVVTDSTHDRETFPAILETYAPKCDGFLGVSNRTIDLPEVIDISASNEWERLKRVWQYVIDTYAKEAKDAAFDAFHFGVESTYVIPDNLRMMLSTFSDFRSNEPMYLGGAIVAARKAPDVRHCGGLAGYTVNRAALNLVGRFNECSYEKDSPMPVDQQLAKCLQQVAEIQCTKTVDKTSALRYIEFGLDYHAKFFSKSKKYVKRTPLKVKPLAEYHGIYIRDGLDGIAPDAVSFAVRDYWGLVSGEPGFTIADAHYRTHAILTSQCKPYWDDPPVVALDANGRPGYIHDVTSLKQNPPPFTRSPPGDDYGVCDVPFGQGREGSAGYKGLQKIKVFDRKPNDFKVLCMIYTHSKRHSRLRAIAETYGPRCDGFLGASNKTDVSIGAVNLLHEGAEEYENMWLKVRSMWKYAHQHYLDQFDFFHIGGDDHYLIPENLIYTANMGTANGPWDHTKPLFLGGNMIDFPHTEYRYCGGGSGYTLNRLALKMLVEELFDTYHCRPHHRASDEDRIISSCFRAAGVLCSDTNDIKNETRYHQASANFHANWTRALPAVWHPIPLQQYHGIASKELLGQISESTISFHLKGKPNGVKDRGMRRYHAVLHDLCSSS